MAASFNVWLCIILTIIHVFDQIAFSTPTNYKYKINSFDDSVGLLEDGLLLRKYRHFCVLSCQLNIRRRSLQSTFNIRYVVNKTTKHGSTTLVLPVRTFIIDLTISVDISPNPGPNIDRNKTKNLETHGQKPPSSCMGTSYSKEICMSSANNTLSNQFKIPVVISNGLDYLKLRCTRPVTSNLVHIPLTEQSFHNTGKHLRLCYLNARSIKNKPADFVCYAPSTGADIFAITKTWLTEDDMAHRAEITLPGYKLLDKPRVGRIGGGIALLFRENIEAKRVDSGEHKSFEFSEWTLQYCSTKLRIIIVYRTPYSTVHPVCANVFLEEFSTYLESVIMSPEPLLIVGDFNMHVNIPNDPYATQFLDLLSSMGLDQHVDKPTHISGNILDLIITRCSDSLVLTSPLIDYLFSDHMTVLCDIMLGKPPPMTRKVTYRKIKLIDKKKLQDELMSSQLCMNTPDTLNQLVECYNKTLSQALDRHAPTCTKSIKSRPLVPWFNEEIKVARREKRKAERKWRRTGSLDDRKSYKIKKNMTNRLMNDARTQFYQNFIEENNTNQKNLFTAVDKLLNQSDKKSVFPQFIDKRKFADQMGSYFVSKIHDIHTKPNGTKNGLHSERQLYLSQ